MSHQVFISHSTKDKQVADAVCHALEDSGISCWIAPRDIDRVAGASWQVAIEEAIETCDVFVLVFSEHVNDSEAVRDEIYLATEENRLIIPYKIDNANWGSGLKSLGRLHWLDAYPNWESQFENLVQRVKLNVDVNEDISKQVVEKPIEQESIAVSNTKLQGLLPDIKDDEVQIQEQLTVPKPSWAETTGKDDYGQYADLVFKGVRQRFRYIEAGEFMMGSPKNETPRMGNETQHKVRLTEGYWMADTVCTQEMWLAVVGANPSSYKGDNLPVQSVSWEDINNSFLANLRQKTGNELFKLPTEAQWEYACRAGTETRFSFGNKITSEQAKFYDENFILFTIKLLVNKKGPRADKSFLCNDWGLYEMHGNVSEWCEDWYGDYKIQETINPTGPNSGKDRVLRGGSWASDGWLCRSASRYKNSQFYRFNFVGFRLISGHSAEPS